MGEPGSSAKLILWLGVGTEATERSKEDLGVEEGSRIRMLATDVRGIFSAEVRIGAMAALGKYV